MDDSNKINRVWNYNILISLFKRKGSEGNKTKIISRINNTDLLSLLPDFGKKERLIILFYDKMDCWTLLTNKRLIFNSNSIVHSIFLNDLIKVFPSLVDNFLIGKKKMSDFTKLLLVDRKNNKFIIDFEKGEPYYGFYQLLHFIVTQNLKR